ISASRCLSSSALRRILSKNPGANITSSVALPAAMASGLPPKVEPCVPAVMPLPAAAVVRNAHREAAAERLGERHDVGGHPGMLEREQVAGAAHAGLHLVEHEQQAVRVA